MKQTLLIAASFVLGATMTLVGGAALLQDGDDLGVAAGQPDMQAMMDKWLKTIEPGPAHRALERSIGDWKTTTKVWWGGPGTPPMTTTGTAKRSWIMGKRYVLEESSGQMLMPDAAGEMSPIPHNGMGITGYDNYRNMYVGCWVDSLSTAMITMSGAASPDGKTFTYYGQMDEPMLDIIGRTVKYKLTVVNEDTEVFEIFDLHAGDGYRVMEITYERAK